jgi:hypothetical protein
MIIDVDNFKGVNNNISSNHIHSMDSYKIEIPKISSNIGSNINSNVFNNISNNVPVNDYANQFDQDVTIY